MSFDFGGLKIQEGFSTIPFKSIYRDLRTVGAQEGIPNFYFSEGDGPNFFGGDPRETIIPKALNPEPEARNTEPKSPKPRPEALK